MKGMSRVGASGSLPLLRSSVENSVPSIRPRSKDGR